MKNKRLNNKGFVLVETLVVAVAVSAIFAMVFKHFYPLIGEYERREDYDDIDSKYGAYWIKRMIQDPDYKLDTTHANKMNNDYHFIFFNCRGFDTLGKNEAQPEGARIKEKREMCYRIVESLEVSCDVIGDTPTDENSKYIENCSNHKLQPHIYITDYNLEQFKSSLATYAGTTSDIDGAVSGISDFSYNRSPKGKSIVTSGLEEYVRYLPKYKFASLNGANKRVIIEYYRHRFDTPFKPSGSGFDTTKYVSGDSDDFLSYTTMEVKK